MFKARIISNTQTKELYIAKKGRRSTSICTVVYIHHDDSSHFHPDIYSKEYSITIAGRFNESNEKTPTSRLA